MDYFLQAAVGPLARSIGWLLLGLFSLLCLASPCSAQTTWERFETALDAFEYERALQIARELPEGPSRSLALAEQAVVSGRPDRSFAFTDQVQVNELPQGLLAKYFFVRARQQQATKYEQKSARAEAVHGLIQKGLRQTSPPRDHARLLLQRIETGPLEEARQAAAELTSLQGVDSRFALMAQAFLAMRTGELAQAATLWKALSDNARGLGERRAEALFASRRCQMLRSLGRKEEALSSLLAYHAQSLDQHDSVVAFDTSLWAYILFKELDRGDEGDAMLAETLRRLPDSIEKLKLNVQLFWEWDPPVYLKLAREGQATAERLKEPVLESFFWLRLSRALPDGPEADAAWSRGQSMLGACDLRGVAGCDVYHFVPGHLNVPRKDTGVAPIARATEPPATRAMMDSELAALDSTQSKFEFYDKWLRRGLRQARPSVAEAALAGYLEETRSLPLADRCERLDRLLSYLRHTPLSQARPGDQLDLRKAGIQALLLKLGDRRDLVSMILDAKLSQLRGAVQRRDEKLVGLGDWLSLMGRGEEALESTDSAARKATGPLTPPWIARKRAPWMLRQGKGREGLSHLWGRDGTRFEHHWSGALGMGWAALELADLGKAESWARQGLATVEDYDTAQFLKEKPYALLALAVARQGRVEEALDVLRQGESKDTETASLDIRYRLPAARVLLEAGRLEEAAQVLGMTAESTEAGVAFYRLAIRRDLAAAGGRNEEAAQHNAAMLELFHKAAPELDDPVFAHFYTGAVASDLALPVPPLPQTRPQSSFAELLERLEQLRRREPRNQALRQVAAGDLKRLMDMAEQDEIFLQPLFLENSVAFICVARGRAELVEVFCDRGNLESSMSKLVTELSGPDSNLEQLAPTRLYLSRWLIQPWRRVFPDKPKVRWMATADMPSLPLSSLYDGDSPVLEVIELTFLDGPQRHTLHLSAEASALLVGGSEDLPGAKRELEIVRDLYPRGASWSPGEPLSRLTVLSGESQLVHIATHGLSPSSRRLSGSLQSQNGDVDAFSLSQLAFSPGTLVVVGACRSAVHAGSGRDNSSLVSALRTAGADVVVGAQWELEDQVTAELFTVFYRALRSGDTPEAALARAQKATRAKHPHPYYWAGLQVVSGP